MTTSTAVLDACREAVVASVSEVCGRWLGVAVGIEPAPDGGPRDHSGITAVLGFGGRIGGFLAIHFDPAAARALAAQPAADALPEDDGDPEPHRAIAEFGALVAGGFRTIMIDRHGQRPLQISAPTVVEGGPIATDGPTHPPCTDLAVLAGPVVFRVQLVVSDGA